MSTFTAIHVAISLIAILTGLIVVGAMMSGKRLGGWTEVFLITTIATSATGFGFPFVKLLPSHIFAVISLIALAAACYALYTKHLTGRWRAIYVVTSVLSLFLNVFVLNVQAFLKVPQFHEAAPTQTEPPFAITQGVTLLIFAIIGIVSLKRFRDVA
jgi:hypothetical protein